MIADASRRDEADVAKETRRERACGVLLFQKRPRPAFLVLYRKDGSPDLPKGKVDAGESDVQAALRELHEETGIRPDLVRLTPGFAFENTYATRSKKSGEPLEKTVCVFHGVIDVPVAVVLEAHVDYAWIPWGPLAAMHDDIRANPTLLGAVRAWSQREKEPA
jgi:8-oxo-dGTP pyrophosphatase MutT (NUDIX family)